MAGCIARPLQQMPCRWRVSSRHRRPRLLMRCYVTNTSSDFDFLNPSKPPSDASKPSSGSSSSQTNAPGSQSPGASGGKSALDRLREVTAAASSPRKPPARAAPKTTPKTNLPRTQPLAAASNKASLGGFGKTVSGTRSMPTRLNTPKTQPAAAKKTGSIIELMRESGRSSHTQTPINDFISKVDDNVMNLKTGTSRRNQSLERHKAMNEIHHLHIYATKHNTHLTLTQPDGASLISVATGVLGLRKANRGTYDAAYQLAAYVMKRIQERGLLRDIYKLELVFRDFGAGRMAVTNALMGVEGKTLRGRIVRLTDATRLKQGGTRSPKPRRLG